MSKSAYEKPEVTEIGSVHQLTLSKRVKLTQRFDGFVNGNDDNIGQKGDPVVS